MIFGLDMPIGELCGHFVKRGKADRGSVHQRPGIHHHTIDDQAVICGKIQIRMRQPVAKRASGNADRGGFGRQQDMVLDTLLADPTDRDMAPVRRSDQITDGERLDAGFALWRGNLCAVDKAGDDQLQQVQSRFADRHTCRRNTRHSSARQIAVARRL